MRVVSDDGGRLSIAMVCADLGINSGFVHTPHAMEPNEKPATYPPATHEKQRLGDRNGERRDDGDDLEEGNGIEDREDGDDQMDELEGGLGEHAFHHPAFYRRQVSLHAGCGRDGHGNEMC
jgi:hypothetical protein